MCCYRAGDEAPYIREGATTKIWFWASKAFLFPRYFAENLPLCQSEWQIVLNDHQRRFLQQVRAVDRLRRN